MIKWNSRSEEDAEMVATRISKYTDYVDVVIVNAGIAADWCIANVSEELKTNFEINVINTSNAFRVLRNFSLMEIRDSLKFPLLQDHLE
ncbi:hypothetical protein V1511DRAFT_512458 [Dipodascopsis uninucleata]